MAVEIVMPRMGLTMEEGTLVAWLKDEGQEVKAGEPLYEIETDKTTVEIESPADGVLGHVLAQPGETFPVGAIIGYITAEGESVPEAPSPLSVQVEPAKVSEIEVMEEFHEDVGREAGGKVMASPAARHQAQLLGVDLSTISGTGPGGRVVAWNVEAAASAPVAAVNRADINASPIALRMAEDLGIDLRRVKGTGPGGRITREDVELSVAAPRERRGVAGPVQPISRFQKIMADRMVASFTSAPHFYLHAEVDARQLVALRGALLPKLEAQTGVRITYTDLLIKLCALTLVNHPRLMAQWREDGLQQFEHVNIGVAMDTPDGLIVPVIFDADRLGLEDITRQRADLVERAQKGKLLPKDLELGVFTITNLGMYRIDSFEAILNPPQAAILAVGRIMERALVENGMVVPVPMMNLTLSIDHRVLDGATGARFLGDLVELIEIHGLALK